MGSHTAAQFEAQGLSAGDLALPAAPDAAPRASGRLPPPADLSQSPRLSRLLPLSLSQREVWLDQRAWPGSSHLNIGGGAVLRGPLNIARLQASLQLLVDRHEALRLVPRSDGQQLLLATHPARLEVIELQESSDAEAETAMARHWNARMAEPFELGEQPPWRFILLRAHATLHGLSIQFHHLVMDGWGTTQLMQAWSTIYQDLGSRDDESTACTGSNDDCSVGASYITFIEDSQRYRQSALFERDAGYWQRELAPLAAPGRKPLVERRRIAHAPPGPSQLPAAHLIQLSLEQAPFAALEQRARAEGLSSFNVLLAALALYFGRLSGQSQVLVGVPSLNRSGQRFRHTPGMFTGLQCLRLDLERAGTAGGLMQQASAQMQAALRHARYPLSELAHALPGLHLPGQGEMLELLLSFERQDYRLPFGEARLEDSRQLFSGRARFPLALTLCEFDGGAAPALVLEASGDCFEAAEAALMARRIWHVARHLSEHPECPLDAVSLLPEEEHWALIHGLHKDLASQEAPQPWLHQFCHQAGLQPQACALVWDGAAGTETMSYGELLLRGEALARQLRALSVAREQVVALAMERSPELVVALLGIGLAGAAFLPLDPQAPVARLSGVLMDSGAQALLLDAVSPSGVEALAELPGLGSRCLRLPRPLPEARDNEADELAGDAPSHDVARPEDLAYVLFTSGSTGRPKGVMVEHGALSRRLAWLARRWQITPQDRSIQGTHHGFDPALIELLLPLSLGASIALPPPGRLHPRRLAEQMARHGATFGAFVPSTLAGLVEAWAQAQRQGLPAPSLRVACCGGELLSPELLRRFQSLCSAQLYNLYGPTEACIFSTAWPCELSDPPPDGDEAASGIQATDVPLGRPVDDTRIHVLDTQLQPMPFGVSGEIYIGGSALARGYLGRPELDAQHFVPDPFLPEQTGARLYRSGDRGWLDPQGLLHFGGRLDRQVKLRGQRIELGDVEAACLHLPLVQQAVVQLLQEPGPAHLHAWLAGPELRDEHLPALWAGLRLRLPEAMRPSGITLLPELPVNAQGKLLTSALPQPQASDRSPACPGTGQLRPPQPGMEQRLLSLWSEALPAAAQAAAALGQHLDLDADFFALGGDSLAALGILASLEDELGRRLPLQLMQEHPSIASLARALRRPPRQPGLLRALPARGPGRSASEPVRGQLFVAASGHGDVLRLQQLADALPVGLQLFMLQPPLDHRKRSLEELAQLYAEAMAAVRETPLPCWLAGFSVGGVTALATAALLQKQELPPDGLILLDSIHPEAVLGGTASWRTLGWLVRMLHVQDLSLNGRRLGAMFSDPGLVSQVQALRGHRCQAFDGPVLLLQSAGLARWQRMLFQGWQRLMPHQLQRRQIAGTHGSIFEPAHVDDLARALSQFMGHTEDA